MRAAIRHFGTMESSWKKNKNMTMLYVCEDLQRECALKKYCYPDYKGKSSQVWPIILRVLFQDLQMLLTNDEI